MKRHLNEGLSPRGIEALAGVADDEATGFLTRLGRARPNPLLQFYLRSTTATMAVCDGATLMYGSSKRPTRFRCSRQLAVNADTEIQTKGCFPLTRGR